MPRQNPYDAPQHIERREPPNVRVLWTSVGVVVVTAMMGGILGTTVGMMLGKYNPGYYREVLIGGSASDFDPVGFGIAAGMGQGVAAGAAV